MASCKLGASSGSAGGPSASSSSRLPPREGDNGMNRRQNGRLHSAAGEGFKSMNGDTAQSLRPSATRYSTTAEERQQHTSAGAEATISRFVDSKTSPFISLLFHRTLTQANLDKEVVKRLNIESLIRKLTPKDSKFIQETCDRYLEYVRNSQEVSIDSHLHDIETAGWDVTDNNVHIEFKKVVNETFDENVTWGGVIGFLGFALGFSIFVYNKGMKQTVVSVAEWTKQVIEEDIGSFFLTHNGWDGFREVVETLLRRQRRTRVPQSDSTSSEGSTDSPSFWQGAIAMTTVAAGAALLVGLRQAFS